jgi:hypothetical protein
VVEGCTLDGEVSRVSHYGPTNLIIGHGKAQKCSSFVSTKLLEQGSGYSHLLSSVFCEHRAFTENLSLSGGNAPPLYQKYLMI